jgi:hypothetical protein
MSSPFHAATFTLVIALGAATAAPLDDPAGFAHTVVEGCGATGSARDLASGAGGRANTVETYRTASFDVACHLPDRSGVVAVQVAEHEPAIVSYRLTQTGEAVALRGSDTDALVRTAIRRVCACEEPE